MKKLAAFFTMLFVFLGAAPASALVDIEGRYWFSDIDGNIRFVDGGVGTDIDLVNDLGMDDEDFIDARITLELGSHRLRYGFMPLKWEGQNTITRNITFGDQTFSASTDVESELRIDYHRLGYQYNIIDTLDNHLGVIFELKYFDTEASLKAPAVPLDETETFKAPIPTIGIAAQASLPLLFSVGGEVTGITLGSDAYLVDAEASINFEPVPFIVISGGYRLFRLHVEHDSDLADLTLKGPFVMLRADF
ncbi:MAG: hypothetical protein H3C68_02300 [Deltaproteobacteria bacterium]|nr:hypothetical protein [Deltaproteobacteria bacterium]MBZ0218912.1 hypothetical protein [Deltaproteobacteria bacterium]